MPPPSPSPSSKALPEERASEEKLAPRGAKGLICPKCRARFDDTPPAPTVCPKDQIQLVRVRDLAETVGDPMLGRTLDGRFTILAKLGAGSMGTVYRARQHAMGRDVAVKILRGDRALDDSAKGRFLREARANSLLVSPHTVTVFDFGQAASGELFLAMELLEGESLGQRLTRLGRMTIADSIETCRQTLRSLTEAHAKGVVHRDLKPDNLFFAKVASVGKGEEVVKVLDFGIAKLVGDTHEMMNAVETQAGTVFGTPRYMSPEQAQGKPLDVRTDLYSLGVILYHVLTGRPPFTDDDAVVVMARHIKTVPQPMSEVCPEAGIPPELENLVQRLLAKEPAMRPKSAEALASELSHLVDIGVANTSGMRFSLARSMAPPPMAGDGAAPSSNTLALAGLGGSRSRKAWPTIAIGAALAIVIFGAVTFERSSSSGSDAQPIRAAAAAPTPTPVPRAPVTEDIPAPPPVEPPMGNIPTMSAEELPRAPTRPSASPPPPRPAAGRHPRREPTPQAASAAAGPTPTAAPTSSSGYGYLE